MGKAKNPNVYEERVCKACSSPFRFQKTAGAKGRTARGQYCCKACYTNAKRAAVWCAKCGQPFTVMACKVAKRQFCSPECAGRKSARVRITCERCGKLSDPILPSQAAHRKFCSVRCSDRAHRKAPKGTQQRLYCQDWRDLRKEIVARDGGRCTTCGSRFNLHVHHIRPWAESQNNSPENLTTLFSTCHFDLHYPSRPDVEKVVS